MRVWRRLVLAGVSLAVVLSAVPAYAQGEPQTSSLARLAGDKVASDWLGPRARPESERRIVEPVWQGPGAMFVERQLAQRAIRSWWPERIDDPRAAAIVDGFATYLQTRAIERLFDDIYLRPGHSYDTTAFFGGNVIWSYPPLRLSRQAVVARDRYGAVFASLEKWLGEPNLQSAMFQVAQLPADRLTANAIVSTISNAAGQDLSWLFSAAETGVSYAIVSLTSTSVTVERQGPGMFTGRSADRVGGFESGDAVRLKVMFENGDTAIAAWDGRDQSRTFQFQGASPIKAAYLDPDGIITFDRSRLDNAIVPPQPTNVPVGKWVARWVVWLQHTMLSYGMLA